MQELRSSIEQMLVRYAAAAAAKDADAFMDLYDADARIFDAWESWSYVNAAAWADSVRGWFGSLGTESVRVDFDEVQLTVSKEMAIVSTFTTYTGMSAAGEPLRSMENRLTWAIRITEDGPKIIHEHTSVPMSFNGMKAILHR